MCSQPCVHACVSMCVRVCLGARACVYINWLDQYCLYICGSVRWWVLRLRCLSDVSVVS